MTVGIDWAAFGVLVAGGLGLSSLMFNLLRRLEGRFGRLEDQFQGQLDERFGLSEAFYRGAFDRLAGNVGELKASTVEGLQALRTDTTQGFHAVNGRIDGVHDRIDRLADRVDAVGTDVNGLRGDLADHLARHRS